MKKSLPLLSLLSLGLIFGGPVDSMNKSALAASHGKNVNWNLSTWGKRRAFTEGIEEVSKYVADKSDGHFTIKINYGGTLSKPRENLDGISLGAFEAATFCASYHADKNKAVTVLELPFLPITNGDVQKAADLAVYSHPATIKEMKKWNAKLLMSAALPQYCLLYTSPSPRD